ncbi:xanthine dehydrogenase accessory factor [Rhizobium aquaticum]|uniref:Xanthine dehydrogenase accessory factor n=1 Tax=Rhizobium aquaticum TaxID=1549636 RepID=A0ABV2J1T6_9HYPH
MTDNPARFLDKEGAKVLVEVASVMGSAPREQGAFMLVSMDAIAGTIGGGQLEYMAIDHARRMLAGKGGEAALSVPLGPEIGQCCGGRVEITFRPLDALLKAELAARLADDAEKQPAVYVFGAGHVGHALAAALSLLPLNVTMVESREHELAGLPENVAAKLAAMPESVVATIPTGSALLILTHDHALDFLIAAEALKRSDLAYVGMIGSATKRATFASWLKREAPQADIARLTLPVGGPLKDKRPAVIAALTAAEIMTALTHHALQHDAIGRHISPKI